MHWFSFANLQQLYFEYSIFHSLQSNTQSFNLQLSFNVVKVFWMLAQHFVDNLFCLNPYDCIFFSSDVFVFTSYKTGVVSPPSPTPPPPATDFATKGHYLKRRFFAISRISFFNYFANKLRSFYILPNYKHKKWKRWTLLVVLISTHFILFSSRAIPVVKNNADVNRR